LKTEGSTPSIVTSRPISFDLIDSVRDPIQVMLKDDILGESFLSYFNPLKLKFLKVTLKETSEQLTALQIHSKVYRFKTVLCGFKNSLSAFIRALGEVLGNFKIKKNGYVWIFIWSVQQQFLNI
jgi:hypothetical protein